MHRMKEKEKIAHKVYPLFCVDTTYTMFHLGSLRVDKV